MPLNRASTRSNNSIYETSTASDFARFFFSSIMDTSADEISQYFNLFALLRSQSFFYLHLPLRKSSFKRLFLLYIFINLLLPYWCTRKAVRQDLKISLVTWYIIYWAVLMIESCTKTRENTARDLSSIFASKALRLTKNLYQKSPSQEVYLFGIVLWHFVVESNFECQFSLKMHVW